MDTTKETQYNLRIYTYEDAIKIIRGSMWDHRQVLKQDQALGNTLMKTTISRIRTCLEIIGIQMDDVDKLNIIHITGTKGKGSTCFFSESILRHCGYKTGLHISPQIKKVRERIQINGEPISKEKFSMCFSDIYGTLKSIIRNNYDMPSGQEIYMLMAFKIFLEENVNVVVLEVGIGGEYDRTNVIQYPVACGVTSIGLDHTELLGETVQEIAWHKGGIFKSGALLVTVPQSKEVLGVLQLRAADIWGTLKVAPSLDAFECNGEKITLRLHGRVQRINAGLALQLCSRLIDQQGKFKCVKEQNTIHVDLSTPAVNHVGAEIEFADPFPLTENVRKGLVICYRKGVNQTINKEDITYHIDGAHTVESMQHGNFRVAVFCPYKVSTEEPGEFYYGPDENIMPKANLNAETWLEISQGKARKIVLERNENLPETENKIYCEKFDEFVKRHHIQIVGKSPLTCTTDIPEKSINSLRCNTTSIIFGCVREALNWIQQSLVPQKIDRDRLIQDVEHVQVLVTGGISHIGRVLYFLED